MEIKLSEVGVRSLMEQSLFMIKEKAMKHSLNLSFDTDDLLPVIQADERKLKQVLYNLLANAVKFTPDGGNLRMKARQIDPAALPSIKLVIAMQEGTAIDLWSLLSPIRVSG